MTWTDKDEEQAIKATMKVVLDIDPGCDRIHSVTDEYLRKALSQAYRSGAAQVIRNRVFGDPMRRV